MVVRLREAAADALESGAPQEAATLLGRALAEPPPAAELVGVLRQGLAGENTRVATR